VTAAERLAATAEEAARNAAEQGADAAEAEAEAIAAARAADEAAEASARAAAVAVAAAGEARDATQAAAEAAAAVAAARADEYGVPKARSQVPLDGWLAVDHLSVWECYLGMCHQSKDVPRAFHERWAIAYTEVLNRIEEARLDPEPLVLERAIKWFFILHQLLLRLDGGGRHGRRLEYVMARRFDLWQRGDYRELVAMWHRDRLKAAMRESRELDKAASIRLAIKLIEDGCLSKYLRSKRSCGGSIHKNELTGREKDSKGCLGLNSGMLKRHL